ncbi:hypothetical protein SNA_27845 [Streptomyces natalensis ATCC 27448]|uniref:Uncharacterized protein n=1 Tax=Streptomyces natalensis ATCC 27448 TaxID=1240678 RepID=A0A0D7CGI7_9ACTN|nr:hypothetical protein SNA_27845 [Streptomyces natalensis ATCC 27448]
MWVRPLIAFTALAVFGTVLWLFSDGKAPPRDATYAVAGECVENAGTFHKPVLFIVDCNDSKADYKVESTPGYKGQCPPDQDRYQQTRKSGIVDTTLCLSRVKH